jgi:hypothetical protein
MAAKHPPLVRGCAADVWWSRAAQPPRQAWSDDPPGRLGEQTVPAKDPEGTAVAWAGLYVPTAHHRLWRCGRGRPVSVVTCTVRAGLATDVTAQGQRALGRIWDQASWPVSPAVQAWITAHNRPAKHEGGCRVMRCRCPSQRPWLHPLEPLGVHGQRAVVEPARVLSMAELMPRVCADYPCDLTDPMAQPDC